MEKTTKKSEPSFSTMPKHYILCFNEKCLKASRCLHRIAAQSGLQQDELPKCVNPAVCNETNCRHYMENKSVSIAYGMIDSFQNVKACHIVKLRTMLENLFGHTEYYRRRNSSVPISPKEQEQIKKIFNQFGYEASFDRVVEETLW